MSTGFSIYDFSQWLGLVSPRAKKKILLQPFIVEAALARMGDKRLTLAEQKVVLRAVGKNRSKIKWPDWWEAC